jgi:hypothetical protein
MRKIKATTMIMLPTIKSPVMVLASIFSFRSFVFANIAGKLAFDIIERAVLLEAMKIMNAPNTINPTIPESASIVFTCQ